jgi:hypothetical protein
VLFPYSEILHTLKITGKPTVLYILSGNGGYGKIEGPRLKYRKNSLNAMCLNFTIYPYKYSNYLQEHFPDA